MLNRLMQSFSSIYLTLISIIQGAVLGYLVVTLAERSPQLNFQGWCIATATFLTVVAGWNEYMMGAVAFVWIPRIRDSVIPFLLGASEFVLVYSIGIDLVIWCLSMIVTCLISILAFMNMFASAKALDANAGVLAALGFQARLAILYLIVSVVALIVICGAIVRWPVSSNAQLSSIIALIILITVAGFLARAAFYWRRVIEFALDTG